MGNHTSPRVEFPALSPSSERGSGKTALADVIALGSDATSDRLSPISEPCPCEKAASSTVSSNGFDSAGDF